MLENLQTKYRSIRLNKFLFIIRRISLHHMAELPVKGLSDTSVISECAMIKASSLNTPIDIRQQFILTIVVIIFTLHKKTLYSKYFQKLNYAMLANTMLVFFNFRECCTQFTLSETSVTMLPSASTQLYMRDIKFSCDTCSSDNITL